MPFTVPRVRRTDFNLEAKSTQNSVVSSSPIIIDELPLITSESLSFPQLSSGSPKPIDEITTCYTVLWRKPSSKKNKTWEGDGFLVARESGVILYDQNGKIMGKSRRSIANLEDSTIISIGSYEMQIDYKLDSQPSIIKNGLYSDTSKIDIKAPSPISIFQHKLPIAQFDRPSKPTAFQPPYVREDVKANLPKSAIAPRHDPSRPDALVMPRPKTRSNAVPIVDVVVDPHICQYLRKHQREGVTFLYECVMGMNGLGHGALLADEMGLGKTLTTIALIWTLLKQNPISDRLPVAQKVIVVCPVTLIGNWKREFRKWLGREQMSLFVVDGKLDIRDFSRGKVYQVMIIGYEKLRLVQDSLKNMKIDLIICDEGHRIKSASNKSAQALRALDCERRVLLTGTPIQNDLGEFFRMIEFVSPGLFENYNAFKREFELPIVRSRQPEATKFEIELGRARSEELSGLTKNIVLRRTADILATYLPPKTELVVFCKPTIGQIELYRHLSQSTAFESLVASDDISNHLRAITSLKKVCNSPGLLVKGLDLEKSMMDPIDVELARHGKSGKLVFLGSFLKRLHNETDEKVVLVSSFTQTLDVLQNLLMSMSASFLRLDGTTATKKRQEIVDTFNRQDQQASFAFLLSAKSGGAGINLIGASRLVLYDTEWNPSVDLQAMARIHRDGQTRPVFIYRLLTTGCIDEKIYQRQLTKIGLADNLVDGKIDSAENSFSTSDLRDLFTLHLDTKCHTHDLLGCQCDGSGKRSEHDVINDQLEVVLEDQMEEDTDQAWISASQLLAGQSKIRQQPQSRMKSLLDFAHIDIEKLRARESAGSVAVEDVFHDRQLHEAILQQDKGMEVVSFVFRRQTGQLSTVNDADNLQHITVVGSE
ncbi:SNF2 family N-terminal domain-containing protein [Lipomyces oligophaga]|uniref:SNF2 family N-terminal domain-containing protein n=1 Tax=Lipomyces oligophaga TaxID=45792 RepID=UPI0034CD7342